MRGCAALLLCSAAAHAHGVPFEFFAPRGVGNRSDGGADLVWFDGNSGAGTADLYFSAVRPSWRPWSRVAPGAERAINAIEIPVASSIDVYTWDTRGVPEGCWQPIARVQDPVEGVVTYAAPGLITVPGAAGWPPSVWVDVTPLTVGTYGAVVSVDPPGAREKVTLTLEQPDGAVLPVWADAGLVDLRGLDEGAWYLHATVTPLDAGACDAWWPLPLWAGPPPPDAGERDAGAGDAGAGDAGAGDAGEPGPEPPRGCGCGAGLEGLGVTALLQLPRRTRRRDLPARS